MASRLRTSHRKPVALAGYAPATALCINMHNYWVGGAADVWRADDPSTEWILHLFVLAIFAWALINFGNVYYGLAQRMLDLTVDHVKSKGSLGLTRSMASHPHVQHQVADMVMMLEAIAAQLDTVARDWSTGVDHGMAWPIKIVAAKCNAVEGAWRAADTALDVSGGFGMFKKSEMERLFRDARAGRFHPADASLSHEVIGKMALGINPDEMPRSG
jgi:alkylation response protein AidB-like acyl-CoA dehydrogenase